MADQHGIDVSSYGQLHHWSVSCMETFWAEVWEFFGVVASRPFERVLTNDQMPGATWFPGARLNYVDQILRHVGTIDSPAVVALGEDGSRAEISWADLERQVAAFAAILRSAGVTPGERVVGYLANSAETIVAFLGCAAVGAVWAGCGLDYGADAAIDRLAQLEPTVLVAATGYRYGDRVHDRRDVIHRLVEATRPRLVITVPCVGIDAMQPAERDGVTWTPWDDVLSTDPDLPLRTEQLPPDHPLWVLFSSGTTGMPKGIIHGHAGVVVAHLVMLGLHQDLVSGDTLFWYTTTNWMLWNVVVSALMLGVTVVTYDGSPTFPAVDRLWATAAAERVTQLGISPGLMQAAANAGLRPGDDHDLGRLERLMVTGAPVSESLYAWAADAVSATVPVISTSGGTDVVGAFVGGAPGLQVTPGELSGPLLGVAVASFDSGGRSVRDQVGELVVTAPLPSMPVSFWNDPDGTRYHDAYFDVFPGIWRHGDWVTHTGRGTFVLHGRSDATLNRNGVRIGSADLYALVEAVTEVSEALVVGLEQPDGGYRMPMFLVPSMGTAIDDAVIDRIRHTLRTHGSPRHVPDEFHVVPAIPHTKTGKKLEVPIKRILQGAAPREVLSEGAVDRPELLDYYVDLARRWAGLGAPTD